MTRDAKSISVRQRLLNLAKDRSDDYNQVLIRYVGLRFLARLAASKYADKFLLKGATMFLVWRGLMHRPTSDIDLLGFIDADEATLADVIRSVCTQEVDEDGVQFDPDTIRVEKIRDETAYGGLRCLINGTLGSAKLRVQLDVGFGDDVTPEPNVVEVPRLLAGEVPRVMGAYTPETVVAEKFEAIVKLGLANSRMKDYLDLDLLLQSGEIDGQSLAEALARTFKRRKTPLPQSLPIGLTEEFWSDELALRRWRAFEKKNRLTVGSLNEICKRIGHQILAALSLAADIYED
ncbi:MAG: nucleotidyl transferase AbiEii/AbiGii toxin family protein [Fimbriimonadaceae bacterium]|nr:nucleotidyl transferase AbiEii/AbiGii toxin family protein [Fimbriimonadaceae bacterium]